MISRQYNAIQKQIVITRSNAIYIFFKRYKSIQDNPSVSRNVQLWLCRFICFLGDLYSLHPYAVLVIANGQKYIFHMIHFFIPCHYV